MSKMIFDAGREKEEVVYIEYCDNIPLIVLTTGLDGSGLTTYDFEFVYGDKRDLRYYESGWGGSKTKIMAPHFVSPKGKRYWMANGCKFKGRTKAKNCKRIDKPIQIKGLIHRSINPFKVANGTSFRFEWCKVCKQWSANGEGCPDHQHWSEEESMLVYSKDGSPVE